MAYDIPSISDLEAIQLLNKHYAEVITSKEGGVSSSADITQTTNPITGVTRRTLYKILDDAQAEHDAQISAHEVEHDNQMQSFENDFDRRLAGMAFTPVGTFTAGATLTDARQTLLWEVSQGGDGHYYSWSGSFPKVVSTLSSPSPIEAGSWVDRTDDSLRDEIRETVFQTTKRSYAEAGYNLVDGSFEAGGVLVNANDVLLQESTGKAFSGAGPFPQTVLANTNPSIGGFTDKSRVKERVSIIDFGAIPGGLIDISAAVRAAVAYIKTLRQQSTFAGAAGAITSGTQPELYFPSGKFKVDAYLTADTAGGEAYFDIVGEGAILEVADGVVAFGGIGYNCNISGIIFRGGGKGVSIKTNNMDTTIINVTSCEFVNQSDYHITIDSNSASTILNIDKCKFYKSLTTGGSFDFERGDTVNITNSWITANSSTAVIINKAHLNFNNVLGVPLSNLASAGRWFDNYGSISAKGSRFGAEFAGAPIVYNYTTYATAFPFISHAVSFDNCQLYCSSTYSRDDAGVIVAQTGLPSSFSMSGCRGVVDSNVICDKISGGMLAYLDAYDAAASKSVIEFNIGSNSLRSDPIHRTDAILRNRLAKYSVVQRHTGLTVNTLTTKTVTAEKVTAKALTTVSNVGLVSNIDTDIYYSTDTTGYGRAGVYDVFISASQNPNGSLEYRSVCVGKVIVTTGFLSGMRRQFISYVDIASKGGGDIAALTTTAMFYDGTTEASNCPNGSSVHQIRLKVSGFSGTADSSLNAWITKVM